MNDEPVARGFLPHYVSWLTIILALLAVVTFFAVSGPVRQYAIQTGVGMMESSGVYTSPIPPTAGEPRAMMDPKVYLSPDIYPYYNTSVPATDTREFLKVSYNAAMRTRDVQGLTRRVETTVRGYGGRIDQESVSPESGYVSFVVSVSKYDAFRTELEGLVWNRFLTVNISSQNLLPQKQSIEEQQKQADSALAGYKAARQKLVSAHASAVKSLQTQIDADEAQLTVLRAQVQTPQIQTQIQTVSNDLLLRKQQLTNENSSYASQLSNADANIKYAEDWQRAVKTQDQVLLDNVATVTGSVSLKWIGYWEMAQLYLPGYSIPAIFAALSLLSYIRDRRRFATT